MGDCKVVTSEANWPRGRLKMLAAVMAETQFYTSFTEKCHWKKFTLVHMQIGHWILVFKTVLLVSNKLSKVYTSDIIG